MTNYAESGVDIKAGNLFIKQVKQLAEATYNNQVLYGVGGFCSLYENPVNPEQLLVASTDGVGSKLSLAIKYKDVYPISNVGFDLVAMVINDIITCGAKPLFFLDYLAVPKINGNTYLMDIMNGIAKGCALSDCVLIGGETAEMPSLYKSDQMDIAGFAVGDVGKRELCHQWRVRDGDVIIGIDSSGPHANGFSLINKIFLEDVYNESAIQYCNQHNISPEELLRWALIPTYIYYHIVNKVLYKRRASVHAMANITGGGLEENIMRVIPENLSIEIDWNSWIRPEEFNAVQAILDISEDEMKRVFNLGIGYVLIVRE